MESLPQRKQNRLNGYDYSQNGCYFVTICTKNRCPLFWVTTLNPHCVGADIIRPLSYKSNLSEHGIIVETAIQNVSKYYPSAKIDHYVIMPDHIHMILTISNDTANGRIISAPTVIGQLKRYVSKKIGFSIWQKSYHDHIIRNESDYATAAEYIESNPLRRLFGERP